MTHILIVTEGFPEGTAQFTRDLRELTYKLGTGAEYEIGGNANPDIREVHLWNVTIKDDCKERFLGDLKPFCTLNIAENESDFRGKEVRGENYPLHGTKKEGFKVGMFRRMLRVIFGWIGASPIYMKDVKENEENQLLKIVQKNGSAWHGNLMVVGELRDGFEQSGPNKGREHS